MSIGRADLIIHPVRLRILQSLARDAKTTAEISDDLKDIPVSSLYRHLRILLEAKMIAVSETRVVQGIVEKRYELAESPRVLAGDLVGASADDHIHYFSTYLVTLLQDFSRYIGDGSEVDFTADRAGYTEVEIFASDDEFDDLSSKLNSAIKLLLEAKQEQGRRRRKFSVITFPYSRIGENDG